MNTKKIISSLVFLLVLGNQVSCQAPKQSYPASMPTPIFAEVPEVMKRGEKYSFSIETIAGVECHAGISYSAHEGKWATMDLPTIESDPNGICKWTVEVPGDAEAGLGEFRGYIENKEESRNIYPARFCIEQCP